MRYRKHLNRGHDVPPFVDSQFAQELARSTGRSRRRNRQHEHKAMQLCRQVQRALSMAMGELGDDLLADVLIVDVTPVPNTGQLLVHIAIPAGRDISEVLARLDLCAPWLRAEAARAITRKRAPELSFVPYAAPRAEEP